MYWDCITFTFTSRHSAATQNNSAFRYTPTENLAVYISYYYRCLMWFICDAVSDISIIYLEGLRKTKKTSNIGAEYRTKRLLITCQKHFLLLQISPYHRIICLCHCTVSLITSVAVESLRRPGFDPRPVNVEFLLNTWALGQGFLPVLHLTSVSVFPP